MEDPSFGKDAFTQREPLPGDKVDGCGGGGMSCLFSFHTKGSFCGTGFKCVIVPTINTIISIKLISEIKNFARLGESFFRRCSLMSIPTPATNMTINILANNNSPHVVLKSAVISGRSFNV